MSQPQGLFGWVDLSTSDVESAKRFYCSLFGWESVDIPTPMGPAYTMLRKDGQLVAGLGPQPPGMAEAGVPSTWNSYLIVDDADDVLDRAAEAGGSVVMPVMDVMTEGRMAMIADPSGAVVGLWQPWDHPGAELFNAPGALTWNELQTRDLESATEFYAEVFGWRWESGPGDGSDAGPPSGYLVAHLDSKESDDTSNAGAMAMPGGVPAQAPSYWAVYFAVTDCDAAMAEADRLGGSIFLPAMDMGPGIRFGGITDPTGAMFMVGTFQPS